MIKRLPPYFPERYETDSEDTFWIEVLSKADWKMSITTDNQTCVLSHPNTGQTITLALVNGIEGKKLVYLLQQSMRK